ncbi:MAG: hypothetical protein HYX55_01435 [Chloroflexi bacterium]|nr:hypothetical protein [Chloroflexota bacterium]
MPTLFVGLHLALAIILSLFGLSFIADPCGGGGDLCLGGGLGLIAFGIAAAGVVGVVVWGIWRRASPLLVWDAAILTLAGSILLNAAPGGQGLLLVGSLLAALFSLAGAVQAGREVASHRVEPVLATVALAGGVILLGQGGVVVLVLGLLALGVGWLLAREEIAQVA